MKIKLKDAIAMMLNTHTPVELELIKQEVENNFKGKEGDSIICKKCMCHYKRGIWNFYNLCNSCFAEFDRIKMQERLRNLNY